MAAHEKEFPVKQMCRTLGVQRSGYNTWAAMGAPQHILPADLEALRRQMELDVMVERIPTPEGSLEWATTVQPFGVTLLEISP